MSSPVVAPTPSAPATVGREVRIAAAALSAVAGVIHFAHAPHHWTAGAVFGLFFLMAGWFQVVWAGLLMARPSRRVLLAGVVANALMVGVWVVTRTTGLPFVARTGAESIGYPDVLSTLLEGAVLLLAATLLLRPELEEQPIGSFGAVAGVSSIVAIVALTAGTVGITPGFVNGHDHTASAADAGHVHNHGATGAAGAAGAAGHVHTSSSDPWPNGDSPCQKAVGNQPVDGESAGGHNHHGGLPQKPISNADRKVLIQQQTEALGVITRYPTVTSAEAAGYHLTTGYVPCIGAHYTNIGLVGQFDPAKPSELLYDGSQPDSKIIGLSYLLLYPNGPPPGFAGPNDNWHQHAANGGLCLNAQAVVIGGEQTSKAECERRGGRKNGLKDIWMVHDWIAPGWDSAWGVFSAENPDLGKDVRTN